MTDLNFKEIASSLEKGAVLSKKLDREGVIAPGHLLSFKLKVGLAKDYRAGEVANSMANKAMDQLKAGATYADLKLMEKSLKLMQSKLGAGEAEVHKYVKETLSDIHKAKVAKAKVDQDPEAIADLRASKVQALFRGKQVRDQVVMPSQMTPILEKHLVNVEKDKIPDLSFALCRQIDKMTADPEKYKGKSVRIPTGQTHLIPEFDDKGVPKGSKSIKSRFPIWVTLAPDGKSVSLLLLSSGIKTAIEGGFKSIVKVEKLIIPLRLQEGTREGSYQPRVVQRILDSSAGPAKLTPTERQLAGLLLSGQEIHKKLVERSSELGKGKFVSIPITLEDSSIVVTKQPVVMLSLLIGMFDPRNYVEDEDIEEVEDELPQELEQEWYNCDLSDAAFADSIPLDLSGKKLHPITFDDKLAFLLDVAESVEFMHAEGLVHRDLKSENVLLKMNSAGKVEAHVGDFDLTQAMGFGESILSFAETSSRAGFVTPYADTFGLIMMSGEAVFPRNEFVEIIDNPKTLFPENISDWKKAQDTALQSLVGEHLIKSLKDIEGSDNEEIETPHDVMEALQSMKDKGETFPSVSALKQKLKDLSETASTDASKMKLLQIIKQVEIQEAVFKEVVKAFIDSQRLYQYITDHPEVQEALKTAAVDRTPKQKTDLAKLQLLTPSFSEAKKRLLDLRQRYNS